MTSKKQTILAFSGRKQAGKGTSYTCIRLWRPDAVEFSFAQPLKQMCVDILGLEPWQAFGNDEQKRTLCPHLLWENFPVPVFQLPNGSIKVGRLTEEQREVKYVGTCSDWTYGVPQDSTPLTGPMSAREVLQYYGTEIFRKQYHNVWADAAIRAIRKSGCDLAVITDCRFENEVEAVQAAGGKVIKLTRRPFPEDNHPSETALDAANFDQSRFDAIVDNATMDIPTQSEELYALMRRWGVVKSKSVTRMHL